MIRLVPFRRLVDLAARIGADPADSDEIRLQKTLLVLGGSFMFIPAGVIWGVIYFLFGEPLAGAIPLSYSIFSTISIVIFAFTRNYRFLRFSQLLLILLLPFLLQVALGGFVNASAVIMWSLICPFGARLFGEPRDAPRWFVAYVGLVAASGLIQPYVRLVNNLPPALVLAFFVANIAAVSAIAFTLLYHFVGQKDTFLRLLRVEQEKSENLLLNILPKEIAAILKSENRTIADYFDGASILFADMVNFTPLTAAMAPRQMVDLLNEVFSYFDSLVEKYDVEKIRTIGDSYMVAAGVPRPRPDHARVLARMALDIQAYVRSNPVCVDKHIDFRMGLNSGPVVAGVIGRKKFIYDLWGDAVNTASRMESHGAPGQIQITRETYELIKDEFVCEPRGKVMVKGKGEMETWYLVGMKDGLQSPAPAGSVTQRLTQDKTRVTDPL
ncbi:MAG TPA: adenylate/guanylate cyclase domain-containing protein [Anaerolineae bacterium]|nr:adenylate/guanylate cyclase domain-containing protein [Anaerolineae bacterium]